MANPSLAIGIAKVDTFFVFANFFKKFLNFFYLPFFTIFAYDQVNR
jgi:hypothetical protein